MSKLKNLTPQFLRKYVSIFKKDGIKGVLKEGGWKIVVYFFLFYLVRDTILYIIIPYLLIKGVIN
tara:strand:+ start:194 stop:388 length:195 start_codon:yes stop_codon:yes gene_type:complete